MTTCLVGCWTGFGILLSVDTSSFFSWLISQKKWDWESALFQILNISKKYVSIPKNSNTLRSTESKPYSSQYLCFISNLKRVTFEEPVQALWRWAYVFWKLYWDPRSWCLCQNTSKSTPFHFSFKFLFLLLASEMPSSFVFAIKEEQNTGKFCNSLHLYKEAYSVITWPRQETFQCKKQECN